MLTNTPTNVVSQLEKRNLNLQLENILLKNKLQKAEQDRDYVKAAFGVLHIPFFDRE